MLAVGSVGRASSASSLVEANAGCRAEPRQMNRQRSRCFMLFARLVRFVPVGTDANFDGQRHAQFGHLRHVRRQFDAHSGKLVVRYF